VLLPALALLIAALPQVAAVGLGRRDRQLAGRHGGARLSVERVCAGVPCGIDYYTLFYYASWCRFDELVAGVALALLKNYHAARLEARLTARGNLALAPAARYCCAACWCSWNDRYAGRHGDLVIRCWRVGFGLLIAALGERSILRRVARAGRRQPGAVVVCDLPDAQAAVHPVREPIRGTSATAGHAGGHRGHAGTKCAGRVAAVPLVETPFMALRQRYVPTNFPSRPGAN
jgi:hypothetical protein